jgi:DNA-binding NarL/FixJ family response regulator
MSSRKEILIIDPSPIFRSTLKEVIQTTQSPVEVVEAGDTEQAENILSQRPVDAVFLDIALPGNNGISFIGRIKRLVPQACVVVLSSHDSTEYKEASIQKGADYFLSKERSGGLRLIDVIDEAIGGRETV